MVVHLDIAALKKASWLEYGVRFLFGGLMTVIAGLVAKQYGPELGGLFLAFPAIAPAAATMIDQHAKEQKQRAGFEGHTRGRKIAALDMFGTVWGSVGLLAFALVIWQIGPTHSAPMTLSLATLAWFVGALATWVLHRVIKRQRTSTHKAAAQQFPVHRPK